MKKLLVVLIALNCNLANAYEYSSNHDNRGNDPHEHNDFYESDSRTPSRYQKNYPQQPIQIFLSPNIDNHSRNNQHRRSHHDDKQYREEQYWRERREELEQIPLRNDDENQFYRDDTHW